MTGPWPITPALAPTGEPVARCSLAAAFLCGWSVVGLGGLAQAQVEDEVVTPEPPRYMLDEANFTRWIYFGNTQQLGRNVEPGHPRIEQQNSILEATLADLEASCGLTAAQHDKLRMAGHLDIKRFQDRLDAARAVYERLKYNQRNVNTIFQETQSLTRSLAAGLFGPGSFFAKTLALTLTPEQKTHREEVVRERIAFRYRAKVAQALASIDVTVGFTAEQSRRLTALILAETRPLAEPAGEYESQLVLYRIACIPPAKVHSICDESQWPALRRRLDLARRAGPTLRAAGLLDTPDPADAANHE